MSNFLNKLRSKAVELGIPLAAHNLFFDGSVMAKYLGSVRGDESGAPGWLNYRYCTYALFRYLSSEGFNGQSHSLKFAMTELLGWKDTNEREQHEWLLQNGWVKGPRGLTGDETEEEAAAKVEMLRGKIFEGKQYKPNKGEMWRVPHEILGKYCALDCYATYRFYRDVLLPAMNKYTTEDFKWWHSGPMLMSIRNAIDNYQHGIFIDHEILYNFKSKFNKKIKGKIFKRFAKNGWRKKHCYREIYLKICEEKYKLFLETKNPKVRFKAKGKMPEQPKKMYDKSGYPTKAHLNYRRKLKAWESAVDVPSKVYATFLGRKKLLRKMYADGLIAQHLSDKHWARKFLFNPASTADKQKFLYDGVEYEIIPSKWKDRPGRLRLKNGVEVDMSESNALPTGKAAITGVKGKGHILNKFNKDVKKLQFCEAVWNKISTSDDGFLHVGYKVPGTNTKRNSGSDGVNLQNLIKAPEFLRAWRPRDLQNYLLYQIDESSVEPHILTELSRCKAMWKIYGPGAKPNDIYIFNAVGIGGVIGRPFLDAGYDPENPTKEILKSCKAKFKDLRNVAKGYTLSDDYGSSAYKKWQTLKIAGYNFTLSQVEEGHNNLRKLYEDKIAFGDALRREWERNGGFVLDGFGFPVCISSEKTKDCTNRVVQGTASLILTLWQYILVPKMWENKIDYYWMIYNFHDELIPEVKREHMRKIRELYAETLKELNEKYLGGIIPIKAEPQVATCLAEIKVEGYVEDELKHLMEGVEV